MSPARHHRHAPAQLCWGLLWDSGSLRAEQGMEKGNQTHTRGTLAHTQLTEPERGSYSQRKETALASGKPLSLQPELSTKVLTLTLPEKSLPSSLGLDFSLSKVLCSLP